MIPTLQLLEYWKEYKEDIAARNPKEHAEWNEAAGEFMYHTDKMKPATFDGFMDWLEQKVKQ